MNPTNGNYDLFDLKTKSLREYLVPAADWFDQMRKIECSGPLRVDVTYDRDVLSGHWMAPYPYRVPVYVSYLQQRYASDSSITMVDLSSLTKEDMDHITTGIDIRIEPFLRNVIQESRLTLLDSNDDCGIVLHGTTGMIHPFIYSALESMEYVNMPVACEYQMASIAKGKSSLPKAAMDIVLGNLYNARFNFDSWLRPRFIDKEGDVFNDTTDHTTSWAMTETGPMTSSEVVDIMNYVQDAIRLKFKVLRVP